MKLTPPIRRHIREALREDIGPGDATSRALLPASARARARIVARAPGTVCGAEIAAGVFHMVDRRIRVRVVRRDGRTVSRGACVLEARGPAASLLTAERTALNFLQRLSGVATLTSRFVRAVRGTRCRILDTRKTTPGWRVLEKYAVRCGGGANHRFGLHDMILIKDNHLAALSGRSDPVGDAVRAARKKFPNLRVEVECDRLAQVRTAVCAGAAFILLDNMSPARLKQAVLLVRRRAKLEASGNVSLRSVRAVARSGVDFISVGALTHSAPALDLSLELTHL